MGNRISSLRQLLRHPNHWGRHAHGLDNTATLPEGSELNFGEKCGFYPAKLGERLNGLRYEVVRKLGWGQCASVWLARDHEESKYVAVKILRTAITSDCEKGVLGEAALWDRITSADPEHLGYGHVLPLLDKFTISSETGTHLCFITAVSGVTTSEARRALPDLRLSLSTTKEIVRQVLLALDYLHSECQIIHTDVKPDNILLDLPEEGLEVVVEKALSEEPSRTYGPSCDTKSSRALLQPTLASQPLHVPNWGIGPGPLHVRLADYGHSTWIDHHFQDIATPLAMRAPEIALGFPWSTPVDIWTVGCLVFELLTGAILFQICETPQFTEEECLLFRILEHTVDEIPRKMLDPTTAPRAAELLHLDTGSEEAYGFPKGIEGNPGVVTIEDCIGAHRDDLTIGELAETGKFMRRCLRLDPDLRPSALELLEDAWLHPN